MASAKHQQNYLGGCTYRDEDGPLLPTLDQLVPPSPSEFATDNEYYDDKDEDVSRLEVIFDVDMAKIAQKYEVDEMIKLTSENLVLYLEKEVLKKTYRKTFAHMYPRIHKAIALFQSNDLELLDRMMEVLMVYKFDNWKKKAPYTTYISPNETLDRSPIVLQFQ